MNDPTIGIDLPDMGGIILSEKDKKNPTLKECKIVFQENLL